MHEHKKVQYSTVQVSEVIGFRSLLRSGQTQVGEPKIGEHAQ
jgi:hypothetical protein